MEGPMEYTVTLTLSPIVYREAIKRASETNRTLEQVLAEHLQETWQPFPTIHISPNRATMAHEAEAYQALHPELIKQQLLGYYVAIHQGKLVDQDQDEDALLQRRRRNYPGQVVLIRQVEAAPEHELALRSPRLAATYKSV